VFTVNIRLSELNQLDDKVVYPYHFAMFVDTHAHLYFEDYNSDLVDVIESARRSSVGTIIVPGIDGQTSMQAMKIAERYPDIWFTTGYHPSEAEKYDKSLLMHLLNHPKCVAVGEIGLDFYRDYNPRDLQESVFRSQLDIAQKLNKPVIIHSRSSWELLRSILDEYTLSKLVLHSFSGDEDDLSWAIKRGFFISIGGPITFKNFKKQLIVKKIPLDRLMLETDCPFLTPQSHRGRRNQPSYMVETAEKLSEIMEIPVGEIERTTTQNAREFFDIPIPYLSKTSYKPKRSLSQNFLIDRNIISKIADSVNENKIGLEIGSGHGELTDLIIDKFERFYCLEPDWNLVFQLSEKFRKVITIPMKFQDIDLNSIHHFEDEKISLVGNLPYKDTSPILFDILDYRQVIQDVVIMVQKEYAQRLLAKKGNKEYGIPTVLLGLFFNIRRLFDIPSSCFKPRPKVDSTLLRLTPIDNPMTDRIDLEWLIAAVKGAFAHRRKIIKNSMELELPQMDVFTILEKSGVDPDSRAEDIEPEQYVRIAENLENSREV